MPSRSFTHGRRKSNSSLADQLSEIESSTSNRKVKNGSAYDMNHEQGDRSRKGEEKGYHPPKATTSDTGDRKRKNSKGNRNNDQRQKKKKPNQKRKVSQQVQKPKIKIPEINNLNPTEQETSPRFDYANLEEYQHFMERHIFKELVLSQQPIISNFEVLSVSNKIFEIDAKVLKNYYRQGGEVLQSKKSVFLYDEATNDFIAAKVKFTNTGSDVSKELKDYDKPDSSFVMKLSLKEGKEREDFLKRKFIIYPGDSTANKSMDVLGYFLGNSKHWINKLILGKSLDNKVERDQEVPVVTFNSKLNETQANIINSSLSSKISLIQGPPGTGKTHLSVELVKRFKELYKDHKTPPILITSASNAPIDDVSQKMVEDGSLKIIRLVSTAKESEYDNHFLSDHCFHKKLCDVAPFSIKRILSRSSNEPLTLAENIRLRNYMKSKDWHKILEGVDVICATNTCIGDSRLGGLNFPVVILDEATQSTELQSLMPLTKNVEQAVLIGDQMQLGPFVRDHLGPFRFSFYERLLQVGFKSSMLDTQYRMHPEIAVFSSEEFYGSKLLSGITAQDRVDESGFPWPNPSVPIFFWDNNTPEQFGGSQREAHGLESQAQSQSISNLGEGGKVLELVKKLLQAPTIKRSDIGIITPYSGQRKLLQQMLKADKIVNPLGKRIVALNNASDFDNRSGRSNDLGIATVMDINGIQLSTVNGFQGREKKYIIYSAVRSNKHGTIGFTGDIRRMNVALTRAKFGLFVVGSMGLLSKAPIWSKFISRLSSKGCIFEGTSLSSLTNIHTKPIVDISKKPLSA